VIRATDRLSTVLARDERLIEVLAVAAPPLEGLRSPSLRKNMAPRVTVAQAAQIAGLDATVLVERLNRALDEQPPTPTAPTPLAFTPTPVPAELLAVPPSALVDLDVRDDLRSGVEPFARIMSAARTLPPESILRVRAIFEPAPLYGVFAKKGLAHFTERLAADDWRVWFFRDVTHHKQIEAALRDLAEHDPLTGVANRRLFFLRATLELARVRRTQRPSALVSIDIDHFKRVNDLHGHAAGDEVLKMLSRRCSGLLREVDLFARVGGEEFAVLLPETTLAEARGLVDRLRDAVGEEFVEVDGQRIGCTFSAGVTALHPDGDVDACLRRADDLLYRAKHLGRNRVEVDA